jgi:prevent-host-death family protein
MIEVSVTETVNEFHRLLKLVDKGESIRITNHGRPRARLIPDTGFMSGAEFSRVFEGYRATEADKAAADEVEKQIAALDAEENDALAH